MYRILRWLVAKTVSYSYQVRVENRELLTGLRPPYVLLANHNNFWDPFFITSIISDRIYFVTSDMHFHNPARRWFLRAVGAIPKTKFVSDLETIKNIMHIKQDRGIIGIFPEGRRSWDGHSLPPLFSTAKLVKLLKIPVIVPLLKGAYLSRPRWTNSKRSGKVVVEFKMGFSGEEVRSLPVDAIFERMSRLLCYSEWDFQRQHMIPFQNRRRAESLELTLFMCPHCRSLGSLRSRKHRFFCRSCGYSTQVNLYGFFEKLSEVLYFENIRDWNLWQLEELGKLLSAKKAQGSPEEIFKDRQVWLYRGRRRNPLKKHHFGSLSLYVDRLEFRTLKGERLRFPIPEVTGINVQDKERLEFYHGDCTYRFTFTGERVSAYKWLNALSILKNEKAVA
jgi:1-acyl-sn-glycerol-3-phosphate acyltransferase